MFLESNIVCPVLYNRHFAFQFTELSDHIYNRSAQIFSRSSEKRIISAVQRNFRIITGRMVGENRGTDLQIYREDPLFLIFG